MLCEYMGEFWSKQATKGEKVSGSFGRNDEGVEQPAMCMNILTDTETTICKWGYEIQADGTKIQRISLFIIPYKPERNKDGLLDSDHQYKVEMDPENLTVDKNIWNPVPGKRNWETISISIPLRDQEHKQISE